MRKTGTKGRNKKERENEKEQIKEKMNQILRRDKPSSGRQRSYTEQNDARAGMLTFGKLEHRLQQTGGNFSDTAVERAVGAGLCRRTYNSGNSDHCDNTRERLLELEAAKTNVMITDAVANSE
jgi:hypothetical protein